MSFNRLMGLMVSDQAIYAQYRAAMAPFLAEYGGAFAYDFTIEQVLQSQTPEPINRVFMLVFPDQTKHDAFFSDPRYLEVKQTYFSPSVAAVTLLAAFSS
ncbi:MAG: DUF1330 domain-containing protein [bacterium]|nr:DUF1330 domain-containing protein [bacterium]